MKTALGKKLRSNILFKIFQETKGYEFESETDTETIPKLIKYLYDNKETEETSFSVLVERVIQQLVSGRFSYFLASVMFT